MLPSETCTKHFFRATCPRLVHKLHTVIGKDIVRQTVLDHGNKNAVSTDRFQVGLRQETDAGTRLTHCKHHRVFCQPHGSRFKSIAIMADGKIIAVFERILFAIAKAETEQTMQINSCHPIMYDFQIPLEAMMKLHPIQDFKLLRDHSTLESSLLS